MKKIFPSKQQGVQIEFPGATMRFNKFLLKELVEDIEESLPEVKVEWLRCKPPWSIYQFPSDCIPSNFDNANMVVIEKHGRKILESFKYRSGGGSIIVYERNLSKEELNTISKILIEKGFESPEMRKASLKNFIKCRYYQLLAMVLFIYMVAKKSVSLPLIVALLLLQIPIWYYWRKGYRIKHGKEPPS